MNKAQEVKVVLLGDAAVGKSSIILRFVNGTFKEAPGATIGGAFMAKLLINKGISTRFKIWDTAGEERFKSLASLYYKGIKCSQFFGTVIDAQVAILVYDITKKSSFESLTGWIYELKENGPANIALVGNKIDLTEKEEVSIVEASDFAKNNGAMFKLTSAKEGKGVQDLFEKIAEVLGGHTGPKDPDDDDRVKIGQNPKKKENTCC